MYMSNDIRNIRETVEEEIKSYNEYKKWSQNPFTIKPNADVYVIPSDDDVADVFSAINNYTGPIVIHSDKSGIGKTTLLDIILQEYNDQYNTVKIGEHNATSYELISIIADRIGVGKSNSVKSTESKLQSYDGKTALIGIDEYGLNDPSTLHTIQYLNDNVNCVIIMTGMTNQYQALQKADDFKKALHRRISHVYKLEPFTITQTEEAINRLLTYAREDKSIDDINSVTYTNLITEESLQYIHDKNNGIIGKIITDMNDIIQIKAHIYNKTNQDKQLSKKQIKNIL